MTAALDAGAVAAMKREILALRRAAREAERRLARVDPSSAISMQAHAARVAIEAEIKRISTELLRAQW